VERQYVMGVCAGRHGSAALLCDGRVTVAVDEQRIRRDRDGEAPGGGALRYCLDSAGITWDDVALLVHTDVGPPPGQDAGVPDHVRRTAVTRQMAHAYAAATMSTFHNAAVAVLCRPSGDHAGAGAPAGRGGNDAAPAGPDWLYALADGRLVAPPRHDGDLAGGGPAALVEFHERVSGYLFGSADDCGQLAALAARGQPGGFAARSGGDGPGGGGSARGRVAAAPSLLDELDPSRSAANRGGPPGADLQYHADVARWAQDLLGDAVLGLLDAWYPRYPSSNLVYAGDLTGNAVLNRLIATRTPFGQVFVQPVAGSAGAAVGCCHYGWVEVLGETAPPQHDSELVVGRRYTADRLARVAGSAAARPDLAVDEPVDLPGRVAALLAEGAAVGWFEGGSELGSRSLGQRSVLAAAGSVSARERLGRITGRPDFAPPPVIVRAEDCAAVFDLPDLSRHQVLSATIRPAWADALPAAAHADGTAVVQCVTGSSHRRLHQLLAAWSRLSESPVLLNERLGPFGAPLLETPEQALALLTGTPLDALVLHGYLIRKVGR